MLAEARAAGFDAVARDDARCHRHCRRRAARRTSCEDGRHGDMAWMATTAERRRHPLGMWPRGAIDHHARHELRAEERSAGGAGRARAAARSPAMLNAGLPRRCQIRPQAGGRRLARASGADVKVFVDTAPLMEKPLGEAAGLGWQGKHTNLVSREFGSWLFLGAILTSAELEPDAPEADHCGSCQRCLDVCPTDAFPAPYQLDARRCIAYLTIEHKGHIPAEFRARIGNRVFGCDDCLAVCPWNKFAEAARETKLQALRASDAPPLADLLALDDAAFRERFAGTPVKRTGRDRVMRNALIAAGNSGDVACCRRWSACWAMPRRWCARWRFGPLQRLVPSRAVGRRQGAAMLHMKQTRPSGRVGAEAG